MAKTGITQEERQLVKLVEQMHLPDEVKTTWIERIRNGEMSEELGEEIRTRLAEHNDDEHARALRNRQLVELASHIRHWRLASQSRNFTKK
jgi:macrodomain Ter protein organizer (MatP/YcbG family)